MTGRTNGQQRPRLILVSSVVSPYRIIDRGFRPPPPPKICSVAPPCHPPCAPHVPHPTLTGSPKIHLAVPSRTAAAPTRARAISASSYPVLVALASTHLNSHRAARTCGGARSSPRGRWLVADVFHRAGGRGQVGRSVRRRCTYRKKGLRITFRPWRERLCCSAGHGQTAMGRHSRGAALAAFA